MCHKIGKFPSFSFGWLSLRVQNWFLFHYIVQATPEKLNLNDLMSQEVAEECRDMNWGTFKVVLTDALVDHLHPIQVSSFACVAFLIALCQLDDCACVVDMSVIYLFQISLSIALDLVGNFAKVHRHAYIGETRVCDLVAYFLVQPMSQSQKLGTKYRFESGNKVHVVLEVSICNTYSLNIIVTFLVIACGDTHVCIFIYEFGAILLVTINFLASILHLGVNLSHQLFCVLTLHFPLVHLFLFQFTSLLIVGYSFFYSLFSFFL